MGKSVYWGGGGVQQPSSQLIVKSQVCGETLSSLSSTSPPLLTKNSRVFWRRSM